MAIGFHRIGYVSRSTGRSAVQAYAYISGTYAVDARRGQISDYRNRASGVACAGIIAPEGASTWATTAEVWDRLESYVDQIIEDRYKLPETKEHYKNTARVAQTHIFALPIELDVRDWEEISKQFIRYNFSSRDLVTGYAIHPDDGNPHLHLTVSLHALNGENFEFKKTRELYKDIFRKEVFSNYSDLFNERLLERGFTAQIDPRSYAERDLDLIPGVHEGWYARDLAEHGQHSTLVEQNAHIREKNAETILHNTSIILKELTQTHATFTEEQLLKCVQKRMKDDPTLSAYVFDSVLKEAHFVGQDMHARNRYTTPDYKAFEEDTLRSSTMLLTSHNTREIPSLLIEKAIAHVNKTKGYALSSEQEHAVYTACNEQQLSLLVGRAGTGKTSSLTAVVDLHKQRGYHVVGMALSAEAARHLSHDAGIDAKTIASFEQRWKKMDAHLDALSSPDLSLRQRSDHIQKLNMLRHYDLPAHTLMIVDEAGMIGTASMQRILKKALSINAKVLLVGDDRQFKAIDAGDIFRKLVEHAKEHNAYRELTQIVRQKHSWMVKASEALSDFNPIPALEAYQHNGHVHGLESETAVIEHIADRYVQHRVHAQNPSGLVITFTNEACAKLNAEIRSRLQLEGLVDVVGHEINGISYSKNDQIIFLQNTYSNAISMRKLNGSLLDAFTGNTGQRITNGTKGVIQNITPLWESNTGELIDHQLVVHIQHGDDFYEATFNARDYEAFQHAYAITLYKSQGQTVHWSMVYATPHMDAIAAYVAMTRHTHALDIYYSTEDFPTEQSFTTSLSRLQAKDLVIDYVRDPKTQDLYDTVQSYVLLGREMAVALKSGNTASYEAFGIERKILAKEILANFEEHGGFILQNGLTKGHLEITAGLRGRTLSHLEERVLISLEQYIEVALSCRDVWQEIRLTHPGVYAKDHPKYADLKALQEERGSLAHSLMAYAPIVRSFGKEIYAGTGYGFSTIQKQAKAFEEQSLRSHTLAKLSIEDQRDIELYKTMLLHQQHATHLYKTHQTKDGPLREHIEQHGKAMFKTLVTSSERAERVKMEMCAGALCAHIQSRLEHFSALTETLKLTLNTDAIQHAAQRYHRLQMIHVALGTEISCAQEINTLLAQFGINASPLHPAHTTQLAHMIAARELVTLITEDAVAGRKAMTKAAIIHEVGLDGLKQIYHLARHEERLHVNMAFAKETLSKEVYTLIHYSDARVEAQKHWHCLQEDARQNGIALKDSQLYARYEQATMQRDLIAYHSLSSLQNEHQEPMARLRQANALLAAKNVSIPLTSFENHAASGHIHQACLTVLDPQASSSQKNDAMETLFTGLMLDDQRTKTVHHLSQHNLTKMYLVDKALEQIGDLVPQHKDALTAYQHALSAYKKTFRDFIAVHGTDFKLLEQKSPEALRVHDAEKIRDEAAYHLLPLFKDDVPHTTRANLLEHLKVTQNQIFYHADRHESLAWVKAFKHKDAFTQTDSFTSDLLFKIPDQARWAYILLERFALECATKSPNSVSYALKEEGLTLQTIQKTANTHIYPHLNDSINKSMFGYQHAVLAFGQSYHALMQEFKEAQAHNQALEHPKRLYIAHMNAYDDFWQARSDLAKAAYYIQENCEHLGGETAVAQYLSERSRQKLGAYAHIHETMLFIQGYAEAKAVSDPIAYNIAHELSEILALEAHEKKLNPSNPLVFGTKAALYQNDINIEALYRDARSVHPARSLRAGDIVHILEGSDPSQNVKEIIEHSRYLNASTLPQREHSKEPQHTQTKEADSVASTKHARPALSSEEFKQFTREVKEQLIHDIEQVAVSLLGQPTRMEKNGIWHWPNGVRLHTRNGVVPRGTFKVYSEGTHNFDIFKMIQHNHGYTRAWDAIAFGATLCGKTLEGQALTVKASTNPIEHKGKIPDVVPTEKWTPIFPVPQELERVTIARRPSLAFMLESAGHETMRFAYRDQQNRLLGYVVRLEDHEGNKQTLPLTYCENGKGRASWKWKGFGEITPLYGLDRLAHKIDAPVLLVEGEKAADAAQKLFPDMAVLSWVGGSAGVKKVDLTPLLNKTVVMWPDNDEAGMKAAATLSERFNSLAEQHKTPNTFNIVSIPRDKLPAKWDLADALPEQMALCDVKEKVVSALRVVDERLGLNLTKENHSDKQLTPDLTLSSHEKGQTPVAAISFEEVHAYTEACGLSFVADSKNMNLILHVANKTNKDLLGWHSLLDKTYDSEQLRIQAITTGVFAAWQRERSPSSEENTFEKHITIGELAGRIKADLSAHEKLSEHAILYKAQKQFNELEKQMDLSLQHPTALTKECSRCMHEEITHAVTKGELLTGHTVSEPAVQSLIKTIDESLHHALHELSKQTERDIIRGVITHTLHSQHEAHTHTFKGITYEAAYQAHQLEQEKLHLATQRLHSQTLHLEQQRTIERQISRGIDLSDF